VGLRKVGSVPYLLRNQSYAGGETFHGFQIGIDVSSRGQLVVGAFQSQQRPRPSHAPTVERTSIVTLAIPVMVISFPARAEGHIHLEHGINHLERLLDQWVAGFTNSNSHQFQETSIHDVSRRVSVRSARRLIGQGQFSDIRVFVATGTVGAYCRINANVITGYSRDKRPLAGDCPLLDVRFEKIGVGSNEVGGVLVASRLKKIGGTDESRNIRGQGRRRIAASLL